MRREILYLSSKQSPILGSAKKYCQQFSCLAVEDCSFMRIVIVGGSTQQRLCAESLFSMKATNGKREVGLREACHISFAAPAWRNHPAPCTSIRLGSAANERPSQLLKGNEEFR
jgi:hypothetical protein